MLKHLQDDHDFAKEFAKQIKIGRGNDAAAAAARASVNQYFTPDAPLELSGLGITDAAQQATLQRCTDSGLLVQLYALYPPAPTPKPADVATW